MFGRLLGKLTGPVASRITGAVLLLLVGIIGSLAWYAKETTADLSQQRAQGQQYRQSIVELSAEVNAQAAEVERRDAAYAQARAARDRIDTENRRARAELEDLKREFENRGYLAGVIPGGVTRWMWLPAAGGETDSGPGETADGAAGADTGAGESSGSSGKEITNEDAWQWCRDVEAALKSCNADKTALREWANGAVDSGPDRN